MIYQHDKIELKALPKRYDKIMDEMDARYPHFHELTSYLRKQLFFYHFRMFRC